MAQGARAAIVLMLLATVLLAGCGRHHVDGVTPPLDDQGRYVIRMTSGLRFEPAEAIVPFNATVVWVNLDNRAHDVAGYHGDPEKGAEREFTSVPTGTADLIGPGESFEHTFTQKGTWTILCHTHHSSGMRAIVHVTAA